jgi:hypothetical protein
VFKPKDITVMSMALDDVCLHLPDGDNPARIVIAERIIDLARRGERSPTLLRDPVLKEAGIPGEGEASADGPACDRRPRRPVGRPRAALALAEIQLRPNVSPHCRPAAAKIRLLAWT